MKRISGFAINHDILQKGMYISRIDGNVITYDICMKRPNMGDYVSSAALHTFEHLFATYARNSHYQDSIVYIGPNGCRTGFNLLVNNTMSNFQALDLVQDSLAFIADFEGEIPGNKKSECGNYLEHDLEAAKAVAKDMLIVLADWDEDKMEYLK